VTIGFRLGVGAALGILWILTPATGGRAAEAPAPSLSAEVVSHYAKAFDAADARQWHVVRRFEQDTRYPPLSKALTWMRLRADNADASFGEIVDFITNNPDWPARNTMRRRAEEGMAAAGSHERIRAWYQDHPVVTPEGALARAGALKAAGREIEAAAVVRNAWIAMDLSRPQERLFHRQYRKVIRQEDNIARLERLLWDRRVRPARRQMKRVTRNWRRLAQARIAMMTRSRGASRLLRRVPRSMRKNPGLLFEQIRWRRRTKSMDKAISMVQKPPKELVRPDRWWRERRILARWALKEEQPEVAYKIVHAHGQTDGKDYAEAEWLAGWIALRWLDRPTVALPHFQKMFDRVSYPVSRSRGAYWLARTHEALENDTLSTAWYRRAAQYSTRFYGQLATGHLLQNERPQLPNEPEPAEGDVLRFNNQELVQVVRGLGALGRHVEVKPFLLRLSRKAKTAADWSLTARLAQEVGRHDVSVTVAKRAMRRGIVLSDTGYPALVPASARPTKLPNTALVYAVVRQESAFDVKAISRAGARGLMQLMPRTALRVARRLRVPYSRGRLTRDPHYNLRLGQAYLSDILEDYDGSLILALAGYNAGPLRVERWLRRYGDPGPNIYAAIDWIESIPFTETRNYVQRVLENLIVYRRRENGLDMALTLAEIEPGPYKGSAGPQTHVTASGADDGEDFAGP
jgi:soluble lytic murein transglycosylase